ncbi:MAG TPA: efflux RND transporter periplasmic adaptor subunit, partial [Pirellulales bacterium]
PVASLGMAMSKTAKLSRRLAALDASPGRPHCVPSALARRAAIAAMLLVAGALGAATLNRSTVAAQELKTKAAETPPPAENPEAGDKERVQPPAAKPDDAPKAAPPATTDEPAAPAADQPVRVRVGRVKRHDFTVETSQPCHLQAARTMAVYARVAGEVKRLLVEIGDHVVKGQPLVELDSPQLAPQAAQAEAQVAAAAAELEQSRAAVREAEARLASSEADRQGAEAEVEAAEVKLTYATKRHARIRKLAEQNAVQEPLVDTAEEDLSAAKAGMKIAKSHSESVKALIVPREAVVAAAQAAAKLAAARLRVAEAELARVKLQGGETKIVSPLDGVVIEMDARVGAFVGRTGKNDRICTVADLRQMRATVHIPERDALKIKRGGSARVFFDAFPGKIFPAKVDQVGFNIGPARTMKFELALASDDVDVRLLPGMDGAAAVALEVHRDALSVPWIRYTHNGVLKVVDGRVEIAPVKFGGRSHDRLEILSGLQEGDIVIIDLADGRRPPNWEKRPHVEIVEPEVE